MRFNYQNLREFKLPRDFRGRHFLFVQLWWFVQATFFKMSPQFAYRFRAYILRLFGASIGKHTVIRPSVRITYPWKVKIGDYVWIGDYAELYSLGEIVIQDNAVVSQHTYLCGGDHDYTSCDFSIRAGKIVIGEQAWLAADVFVAPGVFIGEGAVIGARSAVFRDMPAGMICKGNPCEPIKPRKLKN